MIYWAAVFLIIAIVAGLLGVGVASVMSQQVAWILFIVGLIFALLTFVMGRQR